LLNVEIAMSVLRLIEVVVLMILIYLVRGDYNFSI